MYLFLSERRYLKSIPLKINVFFYLAIKQIVISLLDTLRFVSGFFVLQKRKQVLNNGFFLLHQYKPVRFESIHCYKSANEYSLMVSSSYKSTNKYSIAVSSCYTGTNQFGLDQFTATKVQISTEYGFFDLQKYKLVLNSGFVGTSRHYFF